MDTAQGSSKNQRLGRWLDGESTIESLSLDPHHSRKTPVMDRCNLECVCVGGGDGQVHWCMNEKVKCSRYKKEYSSAWKGKVIL